MDDQGFCEVETPLLWAPTPEGAREFVVPSRLHPGEFYVLPQSPQIAKQLLMVGGLDRYYQIARCLRDEDLRADRQFEFTQMDIEASFVTQDDVLRFRLEGRPGRGRSSDRRASRVMDTMTWAEALDRYGTDKPDLRFGMTLWISRGVCGERSEGLLGAHGEGDARRRGRELLTREARPAHRAGEVTRCQGPRLVPRHARGTRFAARSILERGRGGGALARRWRQVGDLVLVVADEYAQACHVLGALRVTLGSPPVGEGPHRYVWVTEFPLFEGIDEDGNLQAAHHPFTMPHPEDFELIETDPMAVRSQAYDLVLNGWELGSGSVRIHRADIQSRIFRALGITDEEAQNRFGFLLGAFRYGAPPHAGFAFGIDRLVAIFAGEENIREVIAFPKTQSGTDLMTGAPKNITERQLRELHVRFNAKGS